MFLILDKYMFFAFGLWLFFLFDRVPKILIKFQKFYLRSLSLLSLDNICLLPIRWLTRKHVTCSIMYSICPRNYTGIFLFYICIITMSFRFRLKKAQPKAPSLPWRTNRIAALPLSSNPEPSRSKSHPHTSQTRPPVTFLKHITYKGE